MGSYNFFVNGGFGFGLRFLGASASSIKSTAKGILLLIAELVRGQEDVNNTNNQVDNQR